MKHLYFDKYWLIAIIVLLCSTHLYAADLITDQVVVNLESVGTLPDKISDTDKNLITNLKVTGDMNGTDLLFIREMAGRDSKGVVTRGKLTTLDLEEANVPNNEIRESQFKSTKIESIILPTSVQTLGWYAFEDCQSLKTIKLFGNLKSIGYYCFAGCTSLKSIDLPNSVTTIRNHAFYNCTSLQKIHLPKNLSCLELRLFEKCTSLISIEIPEKIDKIEQSVFSGCTSLTSVTLPSKLTAIAGHTFEGCSSLVSINFPESLVSIENDAFFGCNSLITIKFPKELISIGSSAFQGCNSLESITLPDNLEEICGAAFMGCSALKSVVIPNGIITIEANTFANCTSLTSVTLPNSIETIGEWAFGGCSALETITIPATVTQIGNQAFDCCTSLTQIISLAKNAPTIDGAFFTKYPGLYDQVTLTVPVGATGYAEGEWARLKRIASPTVCELTDDNYTITPATYASGNLSYSRSGLKAGNYATFCLPFETNLSDVADAFDNFYTTNGTALCKPNGMLMLMLKSIGKDEVIPAGQPFLAKVSGVASTVTFKNAKMKIIETEQATNPEPISLQIYDWNGVSGLLTENNSLKVSFGGTLTTTTGEGTKLESFNTDGSFGPAKNGVLKPFRSFVSKENAAAQFMIKSISIGLEDGNKMISIGNNVEKNTNNCVYTIDGRLINTTGSLKNLPAGIYILNGQKISIK